MSINSIGSYTAASVAYSAQSTKVAATSTTTTDDKATTTGVIYEKSSESASASVTSATYKGSNASIVNQLKSDLEQRTSQLQSYVEQLMTQQGATIGTADDMWKFLAGGNYTVSAAAKEQAQQAISADGYWGVEQTSDRILEFAKAISGNDSSKAEMLLDAFKKGYSEATKSWGKELPGISSDTYDAVVQKFDNWVNGTES